LQRDGNDEEEKSRQKSRSGLKPDLQEALILSRRAVEIFTRLRHPELQSAQEALAEIEKAMQK
jgi:hypothetical protein